MKIFSKIISGVVIASMLTYYASPVIAYVNEETVYSNLDNTGKAYKSSITTVEENEKGIKTEQVETKKDLPIETKITYYLNGKEMTSTKIAGKSGRITIRMSFENKEKHEDLYTPFVVVAGLMLDNKVNTNIEIKNGKILTNGNSTIAVGIALPGMQESLSLNQTQINIPSEIEISMDTEKFELGNIMCIASPKLLSNLDINMSDFDEIFDKVNALEIAANALENGANTLANGIKTLDDGCVSLDIGITSLDSGIDTLKSGVTNLNIGASGLSNGATSLNQGAEQLVLGINQAVNGLAPSMTEEAKLAKKTALDEIVGINSNILGENVEAKIQGLQSQIVLYSENLAEIPSSESLQEAFMSGMLTMEQVTNYETMRALLNGLIQSLQSNIQLLALTQGNYQALTQTKASISQSVDDLSNLYNGLLQIQSGMQNLKLGTNTLSEKLGDLATGTNKLQDGVNTLSSGSKKLKDGSLIITEGTLQLVNGSAGLADGIKKFNQDGISKITELVNNGRSVIEKFERLEELSNNYTSFDNKEEKNDLKFIAITDSIKSEKNETSSKSNKNNKAKK